MTTRVLIVEDDEAMSVALRDGFEYEGYAVTVASDGEAGLRLATRGRPDLIILDVMLPKMSGLDVCKQLRGDGNSVPIIMLTARGQEIDKVLGLKLGADDYVTKPFSFMELLARVEAVLRRAAPAGQAAAARRPTASATSRSTSSATRPRKGGEPLDLSPREFQLLAFFIQHRGEVVTREQLLDTVWDYNASPSPARSTCTSPSCARRSRTTPRTPGTSSPCTGWGTSSPANPEPDLVPLSRSSPARGTSSTSMPHSRCSCPTASAETGLDRPVPPSSAAPPPAREWFSPRAGSCRSQQRSPRNPAAKSRSAPGVRQVVRDQGADLGGDPEAAGAARGQGRRALTRRGGRSSQTLRSARNGVQTAPRTRSGPTTSSRAESGSPAR